MKHLDNWEKYYHSDRPDPLVQLSIIHAQFEIIHPFLDGNGRIGRMLVPLFLSEKQLLSRPMFHISSYLEENRETYIDRLRMLSRSPADWNSWIGFFLTALHDQARLNAEKARQIIDLYQRMKQRAIDLTHSQYAVPLLDRIFEQPIFQPGHLEGIKGLPSRPMTRTLINKLRDAGILNVMREGSGRRGQILVFSELVDLCEGRGASSRLVSDRPSCDIEVRPAD
jgi:Fic family protein